MKSFEFFSILGKFAPRTAELEEVDVKFILNSKGGIRAVVSIVYHKKEYQLIYNWISSRGSPSLNGYSIKNLGWRINDFGERGEYEKITFEIKPTVGE